VTGVIHSPLTPVNHIMPEQRGDGIQAHATVDGLGRQRVTELVGRDVANASRGGDAS
jgi:hypothetical protein